ncbi:hypothetical protein AGMMS49944_00620 [Spirochaetia bacterium]|nr:hypothetical protein AGMMS49944_00620 [Spirochaetia bacterium]
MKLAEMCNSSPSYIGEIEIGRKFPSIEMIGKFAEALRIEPYHLFVDRTTGNGDEQDIYPKLPNSMKADIKSQIFSSIATILDHY